MEFYSAFKGLRMSGAIPLFRLYAFMTWRGTILLVRRNCKVGNVVSTLAIKAREAEELQLHKFLTLKVDKSVVSFKQRPFYAQKYAAGTHMER
jgi:hypothetical protein